MSKSSSSVGSWCINLNPSDNHNPPRDRKSSLDGFEVEDTSTHFRWLQSSWGIGGCTPLISSSTKFALELANFDDRTKRASPSQVRLYEESFRVNLRLPFHSFTVKLLQLFWIALCSIALNSWCLIITFLFHYFLLGIELTICLFQTCFTFKEHLIRSGNGMILFWFI